MAPQIYAFNGLGGGAQFNPRSGSSLSDLKRSDLHADYGRCQRERNDDARLYYVNLSGRSEGTNVWPYDGSFGQLALARPRLHGDLVLHQRHDDARLQRDHPGHRHSERERDERLRARRAPAWKARRRD
jgi:hypothetical protein